MPHYVDSISIRTSNGTITINFPEIGHPEIIFGSGFNFDGFRLACDRTADEQNLCDWMAEYLDLRLDGSQG
jgi:hypothetical protein